CSTRTTIPTLFCSSSPPLRNLHSFPTRRSSDLERLFTRICDLDACGSQSIRDILDARLRIFVDDHMQTISKERNAPAFHLLFERSEEHTSELQSRFDLVCRLLLEKKKKISTPNH